jgi:hypothetical protein
MRIIGAAALATESSATQVTAICADGVVARATDGDRSVEVIRWPEQPPTVVTIGEVAAMAMYAGCGAGDSPTSRPRRRSLNE